MVTIAIPLIVRVLMRIRAHYDGVAKQLGVGRLRRRRRDLRNVAVVPAAALHRGTFAAVEYAKSLGIPVRAAHVISDEEAWQALQKQWQRWEPEVPLVGLASPYRSLVTPLVEYVREQRKEFGMVTVVIPEFVVSHWWHEVLHNQSAIVLDLSLRRLKDVSVVNFRYQLHP